MKDLIRVGNEIYNSKQTERSDPDNINPDLGLKFYSFDSLEKETQKKYKQIKKCLSSIDGYDTSDPFLAGELIKDLFNLFNLKDLNPGRYEITKVALGYGVSDTPRDQGVQIENWLEAFNNGVND